MRAIFLLTVCLFISTNAFASDTTAIKKGEAQLRESLVDGDSAKFRNVFVHKGMGTSIGADGMARPNGERVDAVCGEVNSKNQMGGYSGWLKFIASKDGAVVLDNPSSPMESDVRIWSATIGKAWKQYCID